MTLDLTVDIMEVNSSVCFKSWEADDDKTCCIIYATGEDHPKADLQDDIRTTLEFFKKHNT